MTERIDVVGAVIVHDELVLCAQRATGDLAGLWEFPGGKVEPGEDPRTALAREVAEELRCRVEVGDHLTTTTHAYDFATVTLATYRCALVDGSPERTEHAELRWLAPAELPTLDWAPADLPAVEVLRGG